ncbi:MAG: antitoxin VbhA family protein [Clostridia bacterium]|nr:antitoxin VbhA family protein [Clostridia bacterium]
MDKLLISQTTKEERKEIIKKALGLSLLGNKMPSDDVLGMAKEYIEGKTELDEIQKRVLQKYKIKKDENKNVF